MTIDGTLSSVWLKDLQKPWGQPVLSQESGSRKSSTFFQFCDHLVSIPGSVSQIIGASYLLRATSWELYGRYNRYWHSVWRWLLLSEKALPDISLNDFFLVNISLNDYPPLVQSRLLQAYYVQFSSTQFPYRCVGFSWSKFNFSPFKTLLLINS